VNVFGDAMGALFGFRGTSSRFLKYEFPQLYASESLYLNGHTMSLATVGAAQKAILMETLGGEAERHLPLVDLSGGGGVAAVDDAWHGDLFQKHVNATLEVTHDEVDEVYNAASRVHALITTGGHTPNDIAVVTNHKRRYEPLLKMAFNQRGIPLDTGRATEGVFRNFVYSLLTLLNTADDEVAVQSVLTSPFYPYLKNECLRTGGKPTATDQRARDSLSRYVKALGQAIRPRQSHEVPREMMRRFATECLLPTCRAHHGESGDDTVFGAISVLLSQWDVYVAAVESTGRPAHIGTFLRQSGFFADNARMPSPSPNEVGFYSCRETKGLSFRAVLVIGCSELLFPSVKPGEGMLPVARLQTLLEDTLPERHVTIHAARTPEAHLVEEYHLLYLALARANEAIHISAPEQFNGQAHPAPAAILATSLPLASMEHRTSERERTPPPIRFAGAWVGAPAAAQAPAALQTLHAIGALWRTDPPPAAAFAIEPFPLSQSALTMWLNCERQFFYRRVLRLLEDDSPERLLGLVFHKVMARLGERYPTKRALLDGFSAEELKTVIGHALDDETTLKPNAFVRQLLMYHLERMAAATIKKDVEESDDYSVEWVERDIKFDRDGRTFSGRVDRTERTSDGRMLVVDYKSGDFRKRGEKAREKALSALGSHEDANWQVPLYVAAYRDEKKQLPDAFKLVVSQAGKEPFLVTLYIRKRDDDVPLVVLSKKRVHQGYSFLLESEIDQVLEQAVIVADSIFEGRHRYDKTDHRETCRICSFRRLCGRDAQ
jgi:hypothetical protein